jgi:hypothetical protein
MTLELAPEIIKSGLPLIGTALGPVIVLPVWPR